jgi:long-chain fatty acid transport protein
MRHAPRILVLAAGFAATTAHGAGFGLIEQSASGMGVAFAGSAARANDPSLQYFNPAGLASVQSTQVSAAVHLIDLTLDFREEPGSMLPPAGLGVLPVGATAADAGDAIPVPNLHFALPLRDGLVAGFSVSAPYGLKTEYPDPWIGRFQGIYTELETINVNPAIGWRVNEFVSVGVGLSWQTADATLTHAVMLGAGLEGRARLEVDDNTWGWNAGIVLTPREGTRIGLSYRSRYSYDLGGTTTVTGPNGATIDAAGGPTVVAIDMPEQAYLSLEQAVTERFTMLADVSFTRWGSIQSLNALDPATGTPRDRLDFGFDDTWRFALGGEYAVNERWLLRAGAAYDESPVTDAVRTVRLPDESRTWVTVGAQWRATPQLTIDAGYAHLFVSDAPIDHLRGQLGGPASFASRVVGRYESEVDILSVQVAYRFD